MYLRSRPRSIQPLTPPTSPHLPLSSAVLVPHPFSGPAVSLPFRRSSPALIRRLVPVFSFRVFLPLFRLRGLYLSVHVYRAATPDIRHLFDRRPRYFTPWVSTVRVMDSDSGDPSAEQIFSAFETEFTRVAGHTPPTSPGQTRCLYSFRVDVVVERLGRRYRLVSVRPVRNPGGPYFSNVRREYRHGPPPSPHPTGYGSPTRHPYDPPIRQHHRSPAAPASSSRHHTGSASPSAFGGAFTTSTPRFSFPSPLSFPRAADSAPRPTFDRESHQRFMKKLELLVQAEERWKAQKAREAQAPSDSVRDSGGDKTPPAPR